MKFKTLSGSIYELDTENKRVRRCTGSQDPTHRQGDDGTWKNYIAVTPVVVGLPVIIGWGRDVSLFPDSPDDSIPGTITSVVEEIL